MIDDREHVVISVIIPMYNGSDSVCRSLENLEAQSFELPYEVIIVDDKSTDNSVDTVKQFISKSKKPGIFNLIECEKNGRAGRARNIGVDSAKGEYVLFIDQDDYPDRDILKKLYDISNTSGYDLVSCAVKDKDGSEYARPELDIADNFSDTEKKDLMGRYGYIFASLIRRRILKENDLRFPEGLMFEDSLYNEGIIACIDSIITTEEAMYFRETDDNSQTAVFNVKKLHDRVDATMEYIERYSENEKMEEYMESFRRAALYYVFLSCVKWMIASPELYDRELLDKCLASARSLDPDWDEVMRKEHRIRKRTLFCLKMIYYHPRTFYMFKTLRRIKG